MNWQPLIEFVVSLAYGILSSPVPIFNSEIYIVAFQVGGFIAEVTTAVGCAIGQTIGKVGIVVALRRGGNSRLVRRLRGRPRNRPSARSASCSPCAGAAVPVWYGGYASGPASRPVAFGQGCEPGRTAWWGSWANAGEEC